MDWILFLIIINSCVLLLIRADATALLPKCLDNAYVNGDWKYDPTVKKSFYCCGWDAYDFMHDSSKCVNSTDWSHENLFLLKGSVVAPNLAHTGGHGCSCDAKGLRNGTNLREQYVWVPDTCSFDSWNAKTFCTILGNRTVLIVGDSTLQQVAVTLINMIISNNGNCADKITFAKSYFLTFKKWGERKKNIFEFVEDINPDIVVFSAGAHLHDLGDLYSVMENLRKNFPVTIEKVRQQSGKNLKLVWKTQNPGHVNCGTYHGPQKNFSLASPEMDNYCWNLHPVFDEVSKNYSSLINYQIIDMTPVYYRPDSHPGFDCLHYCVPGALDIFSTIFMNKLLYGEI